MKLDVKAMILLALACVQPSEQVKNATRKKIIPFVPVQVNETSWEEMKIKTYIGGGFGQRR